MYGSRHRGTGILNNDIFDGRLLWKRLRYVKDPETGKRRSRWNAGEAMTTVDVPELYTLLDAEWQAANSRQLSLDSRAALVIREVSTPKPYWSKQRPRYLFSGLMRCGVCGGVARQSGWLAASIRMVIRWRLGR